MNASSSMKTQNFLYIDPDHRGRMGFKQAAQIFGTVSSVVASCDLHEGLERLETGTSYSIVYLSSRFSKDALRSFIAAARETQYGSQSAYIVVVDTTENNILAEYALLGADGFLSEPYTSRAIAQSVIVAHTARVTRDYAPHQLPVDILIKAAIENFSSFVQSQAQPSTIGAAREKLLKTRQLVETLDAEGQQRFLERLAERLTLQVIPMPARTADSKALFLNQRLAEELQRDVAA